MGRMNNIMDNLTPEDEEQWKRILKIEAMANGTWPPEKLATFDSRGVMGQSSVGGEGWGGILGDPLSYEEQKSKAMIEGYGKITSPTRKALGALIPDLTQYDPQTWQNTARITMGQGINPDLPVQPGLVDAIEIGMAGLPVGSKVAAPLAKYLAMTIPAARKVGGLLTSRIGGTFTNEMVPRLDKVIGGMSKKGIPGAELERRLGLQGFGDKAIDDYQMRGLLDQPNVTPQQVRQHVEANPLEIQDIVKGGRSEGRSTQVSDELVVESEQYPGTWVAPSQAQGIRTDLKEYRLYFTPEGGEKAHFTIKRVENRQKWGLVPRYKVFNEEGNRIGSSSGFSLNQAQVHAHNAILERFGGALSPTRWGTGNLVTPGGTNYREILGGASPTELRIVGTKGGSRVDKNYTDTQLARRQAEILREHGYEVQEIGSGGFQSGHFDEPHYFELRVNDRVDIDGNDMLFIEEIQSDWGQAWKKWEKAKKKAEKVGEPFNYKPPPEMQFKKNWQELAFKRAVGEAINTGKTRVAWTPGLAQVDRYQDTLRQRISGIKWDWPENPKHSTLIKVQPTEGAQEIQLYVDRDGVVAEAAWRAGGGGTNQFVGKTAAEIFGQDIADKILARQSGNLTGEGLTIGGEGMKGFYDKIIPDYARKFGKRYNAKVGKTHVPTPGSATMAEDRRLLDTVGTKALGRNAKEVWYMDITPEMIKDFNEGGFKLYSQAKGMLQFA